MLRPEYWVLDLMYVQGGWAPKHKYRVNKEGYEELGFIYLSKTEVHIVAQEARPVACVLSLESLTQ
jgi:hypothetical protein